MLSQVSTDGGSFCYEWVILKDRAGVVHCYERTDLNKRGEFGAWQERNVPVPMSEHREFMTSDGVIHLPVNRYWNIDDKTKSVLDSIVNFNDKAITSTIYNLTNEAKYDYGQTKR